MSSIALSSSSSSPTPVAPRAVSWGRFALVGFGTVIAAVTHAELVRYAVLRARGRSLCRWAEVEVAPASITTLQYAGTRVLA